MNQRIKRILLAVVPALCCLSAMAQWDLEGVQVDRTKWVDYSPVWNPDPQVMIPGGGSTGIREQAEAAERAGKTGVARLRRLQSTDTTLPTHWNNAETSYFPPVFNQAGGSCGVSSRVGYMLNEELNAYRGTNAKLDENHLAPNFQYPFSYNGTGKETMAYYVGYPDAATYGGFPYSNTYGFSECESNNAGWMQGYDKWFISMHNRIWSSGNFPVGVIGKPTDNTDNWGYGGFGEGALAVKRWLYNHNGDDSFHTGGILGLGCASGGYCLSIPSSTTNDELGVTGKYFWVTGTQVDHAITMVGYDDRIEFDLDGNGTVGERNNASGLDEVGAWIIVNSWGGWCNGGFIYVPYALATPTCVRTEDTSGDATVYIYTGGSTSGWTPEFYNIRKDYSPERTIKIKMSFTQRSAIQLQAGISTDLNATEPDKLLTFHHFNYQGDGDGDGTDAMTPMLGRWSDGYHYEAMEFGYDLTDLGADFDRSKPLKYFFIINSNSSATGVGGVHAASIIDYSVNENGTETPFAISGDSVEIGNGGASTVLTTIVYGEPLTTPANPYIDGTTLQWSAPQGTAYVPDYYILYKDGVQVGTTTSLSYDLGTNTGVYTVSAHYDINGNGRESVQSASVDYGALNDLAYSKYITSINKPLTTLDELTEGMTVVLYNKGRGRYIYDNGSGTNYLFTGTSPVVLEPEDYKYVFTVGKSGEKYTFTSMSGSLPAISHNSTLTPSSSAGTYTVAADGYGYFTLYSNAYLNGNDDKPVGWNALGDNSLYKIIPVDVSNYSVGSLGDYTSMTADNLEDGQAVALYNNGRNYYMVDQGSSNNYIGSATSPVGASNSSGYVFRIGKNNDGTVTLTSQSGSIGVLPYNSGFTPSSTADNLTLTDLGGGLFRLQSSQASGNNGRQYLDGNDHNLPVGWNAAENNGKWRFYPVTLTSNINAEIVCPTNVYASVPAQFSIEGDEDIVGYTWSIDGTQYTSPSPTVTFTTAGTKSISCTVANPMGATSTVNTSVTVLAAPSLTAEFDLSVDEVTGDDRISFLPVNQVAGCTYSWEMPGADEETATTRNASASYSTVGEKTVTLTVTSPNAETTSYSRTFNVLATAPKLDYQLSSSIMLAGETLTITDKSKYGPTSWRWDLVSDLNIYSSIEQNPTFTPKAGVYDLHFTAKNDAGSSTTEFSRAVTVCTSNSYNGLNFNGGSMQVVVPLSNNISTAWTIDFWLNPTSMSSPCFGLTSDGGVSIVSDGAGTVSVKNGSSVIATSSINYYVQSQWHHYAITFDGSTIYFYRDGSVFSSTSCSVSDFSGLFSSLTIGGSDAPGYGIFDEFRVWNTCLTQEKIRTYAVAPISDVATAMSTDGLDVYYQFNQSSGNVTDATTNGHTGTRSNFGPDGDAWSLSDGVFCLNFTDQEALSVSGEVLDNSVLHVESFSDEEIVSESSPARYAVDGSTSSYSLWHSNYGNDGVGFPHSLTIRRDQLDVINYIVFNYSNRSYNYRAKYVTVEESEDGTTWNTIDSQVPLMNAAQAMLLLSSPVTKQYMRITFNQGYGSYLAIYDIAFYGSIGNAAPGSLEVPTSLPVDIHTGELYQNGSTPGATWCSTWKALDYPQITVTCTSNNMKWTSGNVAVATGSGGSATYTISAASPFTITGYSFDGYAQTDVSMYVTPDGESAVEMPSQTSTSLNVTGLSTNSTTFTVTADGNHALALNNFVINLEGDASVVEYQINDEAGNLIHSEEVLAAVGENITSLPSDLQRDYCTYSAIDVTTVAGRNVIPVTCTWTGPFTISKANDTTYYDLKIKQNTLYAKLSDGQGVLESTQGAANDGASKWAFFGNPYIGFLVTNATASNKYLYTTTSDNTITTMSNVGTRFFAHPSNVSSDYFVLQVGSSDTYLNNRSSKLSTWASSSSLTAEGSALQVVSLGDYAAYVVSDVGPYLTTNIGSGYVGTLSSESSAEFNSDYTTYSTAATFSQYWTLLNRVKQAAVPLVSGGYYRLRNNYTGKYAYMNNTDRLLYVCANKAAAEPMINSVFQFVLNDDGTYTLNVEGTPVYGVTANNKVFSTLSTTDGASTSTAFTVGNSGVGTYYLTGGNSSMHSYQLSTVIGWGYDAGASQWNIEPAEQVVLTPNTVNGVGYTTLCLPFNATIDADKASNYEVNYYMLENTTGDILTVSRVDDNVIPANTGVLLRNSGTDESVTLTIGGTSTADLTANVLQGSNLRIDQPGTSTVYVFSTKSGTTKGFFKLSSSSMIPANKAYFTDAALSVRGFLMDFDDGEGGEVTSIDDIQELMEEIHIIESGAIYDMQGRRVTQPRQGGVYIIEGQKIYVK